MADRTITLERDIFYPIHLIMKIMDIERARTISHSDFIGYSDMMGAILMRPKKPKIVRARVDQ